MCGQQKNAFKKTERGSENNLFYTWDVFGPADDDHQLAVSQVAQRGQSLDVTLRHGGVRHGIDLLWLHHQQMGNDLRHWKEGRTDVEMEREKCNVS